jgi:hypothetical protein
MTAKPAKMPVADVPENLQGFSADAANPERLRHAIDLAFDYRGDVTIIRKSNPTPIEGYLFDRHTEKSIGELIVRIIPKDSDARIYVPLSDIASVVFSGKDTASGKSFENWIRKYAQKKLAGEAANIESEPLDEG